MTRPRVLNSRHPAGHLGGMNTDVGGHLRLEQTPLLQELGQPTHSDQVDDPPLGLDIGCGIHCGNQATPTSRGTPDLAEDSH